MNEKLMEALAPGSLRPKEESELNAMETATDTTGRLDVLLYGMAERFVEQSAHPGLISGWSRFRNPLAELLEDNLGPVPKSRKRRTHGRPKRRRTRKRRVAA